MPIYMHEISFSVVKAAHFQGLINYESILAPTIRKYIYSSHGKSRNFVLIRGHITMFYILEIAAIRNNQGNCNVIASNLFEKLGCVRKLIASVLWWCQFTPL